MWHSYKNKVIGPLLTAGFGALLTTVLAACAPSGSSESLDRLVAIQDIKELRSRFVNAVDNRRFDELRNEIFTPDAVADLPEVLVDQNASPEARKRVEGAEAIIEFVRGRSGDKPGGNHAVTNPIITLTSATTAEGIWRMGSATYYDDYQKIDGRWRLKTIRFEPFEPGPAKTQ